MISWKLMLNFLFTIKLWYLKFFKLRKTVLLSSRVISLSCNIYIYDFKEWRYIEILRKKRSKISLSTWVNVFNSMFRKNVSQFLSIITQIRCHTRLKTPFLPFSLFMHLFRFPSFRSSPSSSVINVLILFRDSWLVKRVRHVNQSELIIMFFAEQGSLLYDRNLE